MLDALGPRFKRNMKNGRELGPWQWVVELTLTWLNQLRRLRVRFEERADIHEAFLALFDFIAATVRLLSRALIFSDA